jgi:hypothetical protein
MGGSGIVFSRNGLEQLQSILGLRLNSPPLDVVFVSFDLEPKKDSPNLRMYNEIAEIGISMLDTRNFSSHTPAGSLVSLATRHFVVGGHKRLVHTARGFHFGTSEHVDPDDVNEIILKLLHIPDELESLTQRRYRNIVLVGHGLRSDLLILRKRGILFEEISTIVAKFDTTYMAKEVLGMNFRLQGLLQTLHCPDKNLHNAGNDANFALRALLLLAYYGLRPSASSADAICMLTSFKALALEPLPDTTKRNAMLRALKPRCEDWTLNALEIGTISFFDEV